MYIYIYIHYIYILEIITGNLYDKEYFCIDTFGIYMCKKEQSKINLFKKGFKKGS